MNPGNTPPMPVGPRLRRVLSGPLDPFLRPPQPTQTANPAKTSGAATTRERPARRALPTDLSVFSMWIVLPVVVEIFVSCRSVSAGCYEYESDPSQKRGG